jgi:hypothetical protein
VSKRSCCAPRRISAHRRSARRGPRAGAAQHPRGQGRCLGCSRQLADRIGHAKRALWLRQHSTPYHLAHGLLDHAQHLLHTGDAEAAGSATGEARGIAEQLGCQPLLDRADITQPATPHIAAS